MNNCCYDCQMINLGFLLIDTIKNQYSEPKHINTERHKKDIEELKYSIKVLTQMVVDRDYIIEDLSRQVAEHKDIKPEPKHDVPDVGDTLLKDMMEKAMKHSLNPECKTVRWVIGNDYFIRNGERFMMREGKLYKEIPEERA